jgi:hypothetical protein
MTYTNYFDIEEFLIAPDLGLPLDVINKLINLHLPILNDVRAKLGAPLKINSAYRPVQHELANGRKGDSQHVFKGNGAVDLSASDMKKLEQLLFASDYKRVCVYPTFIHCDFKGDERLFYRCDSSTSNWKLVGRR